MTDKKWPIPIISITLFLAIIGGAVAWGDQIATSRSTQENVSKLDDRVTIQEQTLDDVREKISAINERTVNIQRDITRSQTTLSTILKELTLRTK